jgi:ABC-2 type transport system ATP-binding protein
MTVVECENLSKWYGDVVGLNNLTVEIDEGITGLLGPNGAGKSTFMRLVTGLIKPSQGWIRVLGEEPWDNTPLRERVGYVPEGSPPWPRDAGRDVLVHGARLGGMTEEEAEAAADRTLEKVGLTDAAEKRVEAYSQGMGQRLKFGLALLHEPELLILDEPLAGTDPIARRDLIDLIERVADEGRSIILTTHVLPNVEAMTQRILLLNHGRLLAHGDVHEIPQMLDQYPRTIEISTDDPLQLREDLAGFQTILSLEAREGSVVVRTEDPSQFYENLQDFLLESDYEFGSIKPLDENVESIFKHLVE